MTSTGATHALGPILMDRALMERFAEFTGDRSPLHMDAVHGQRSMYGTNVVHGMLPLLFLPYVLHVAMGQQPMRITRINGQFLQPIIPGEWVNVACSLENSDDAGRTLNYAVTKTGSGTLVTRGTLLCVPDDGMRTNPAGHAPASLLERPIPVSDHAFGTIEKGMTSGFPIQWGPAQRSAYLELVEHALNGDPPADPQRVDLAFMALTSTFSTLVGMCMPGSTATFLSFSAEVATGPLPDALDAHVSASVNLVSGATRSITQDIHVRSGEHVLITGNASVLVAKPDFIPPSMQELLLRVKDPGLRDRIVLITGASRGIGATTAKLFAAHGAKVVINYRSARAEAETVANEINACGGDAIIHKADVTDPEQVRAMINEIVARSGTVHVLVNSAASNFRAIPFLETTWENVQDDLDVIVKGAFNCAQAVLPLMIAQGGGKIVNLSTVAVEVPPQDQFKYVVAKSALTGITRSLAVEFAEHNIQVNQVVPSMVETDLTRGISPVVLSKLKSASPMKRLATATDVAEAIVHLASNRSDLTTGQKYYVTGGLPPFA